MTITGRIIKGISGFYYVHDGHSRIFECKAKGVFRNLGIKPLVGDVVDVEIIDEISSIGNIVSIHDRKNTLLRPAVANIDQVVLVFAITSPLPSFNLLDRLLVYYKYQDIPVTICFNKVDLVSQEEIDEINSIYKDSDASLMFLSAKDNEGVDLIKDTFNHKTSVISGPSGVGKSTLINLLVPNAKMETGEISEKLKRGKHTTRHTELFFYRDDSFILDTPGFTSFNLDIVSADELKRYYPEFESRIGECKFDDCVHIKEIECCVKELVSKGIINITRYDNYTQIYSELQKQKRF